jgi:hypothetical protein
MALNIGTFYAMRMEITGTIWEPILLHLVNNFFASFSASMSSTADETPGQQLAKPSAGTQTSAVLLTSAYYVYFNTRCWAEIGGEAKTEGAGPTGMTGATEPGATTSVAKSTSKKES